ncbi:uncharacterized protein LOC133184989 [Saccostrea echinata]|uniref:uncharacterized protein LOC133184989 n=1 Tax=Saccostrea echinata TaxID=191078 RepID=UPI002A7EEE97|nr:uncharacterized protein LOC133184989 [Saccostrea echinata]
MESLRTLPCFVHFLVILGFSCSLIRGDVSFTHELAQNSSPACYGSDYTSFVNAGCNKGSEQQVVFPVKVVAGAKPNSTGCMDIDNDYIDKDSAYYNKCCKQINTIDCVDEYIGPNRTTFMINCIGRRQCEKSRVIWKLTRNMSCSPNETWKDVSNYAYLEYYCIDRNRMETPHLDLKIRNQQHLYLTTSNTNSYQSGTTSTNVTCFVQTSNHSDIEVWIMDLRLNASTFQNVTISDGSSLKVLKDLPNNDFTPRLISDIHASQINVTFETKIHREEFIWLGFKAGSNDEFIEITCDESGKVYIQIDPAPLSEEQKQNGMIIASVTGGLGFLVICIIFGVAFYRRYKIRKIAEEKQNLSENED